MSAIEDEEAELIKDLIEEEKSKSKEKKVKKNRNKHKNKEEVISNESEITSG